MSNLYAAYKKKRMFDAGGNLFNSGLADNITSGTGADIFGTSARATNTQPGINSAKAAGTTGTSPGIGAGITGNASAIGSVVNEGIDTFSKGDPLTGRKSIGSTVGKSAVSGAAAGTAILPGWGTLIGGVVGAGVGFFKGKKEKKDAEANLNTSINQQKLNQSNMSNARLQSDPNLFSGYKGAGYFAMGGSLGMPDVDAAGGDGGIGGGGGSKKAGVPANNTTVTGGAPQFKTRKLSPSEMGQWNGYLDFVKSKGFEGSEELNSKDKNLGASLFQQYKQSNPGVTIGYDIVPSVQQEMQNLKATSQDFAQRHNVPGADKVMSGVSPVDNWFGSKTSQFRFPNVVSNTSGKTVDHGLVNSQWETTSGQNKKPIIPPGAQTEKMSDGKTYYMDSDGGWKPVDGSMALGGYMSNNAGNNPLNKGGYAMGGSLHAIHKRKALKGPHVQKVDTMHEPQSADMRDTMGGYSSYSTGGPMDKKSYNPNLASNDTGFQSWFKANTPEGKSGASYSDKGDYDYYSYYRNGDATSYKGGHFPDTYKRTNHSTFSDESIYSTPENKGGHWNGEVFSKKADGGSIHINPENKDKFTAWASDHHMGVQEAASKVMGNKEDYSGGVVKMANFARNFGGRKEMGGNISAPLAHAYMNGGYANSMSSDTAEIKGPSHANGGVQIPEMGAEVEGGETTSGDFVFSKRLGFADLHKPIAMAKGKIEQKPMTFDRVNGLKRLNAREQALAMMQERIKQAANG